jgi:hypothetical protein
VHFDLNREQIVYLVPECCMPVGMTEEMRSDKAIFRQVKMTERTDAPIRVDETK